MNNLNAGLPMFSSLESDWLPPTAIPDGWIRSPIISIDTETYDPQLLTRGPGALYGAGKLLGVSVAVPEAQPIYIPLGHRGDNVAEPQQWTAWLKDLCKTAPAAVGANLMYDMMWLKTIDVEICGTTMDIQTAAALVDEERRSVSLENLAKDYRCQTQKDGDGLLKRACRELLGVTDDLRKHLWKLPARYVGPYAEADAAIPLELWEKLQPKLAEEDLMDCWALECALMPVLVRLMQRGVRVDVARAEGVAEEMDQRMGRLKRRLRMRCGMDIDIWAINSVVAGARRLGLTIPKTKTGKDSVTKVFLKAQTHEYWEIIKELRQVDKLTSTFIRQNILEMGGQNGRIYPQYRAIAKDDGGTRIGRLSAYNPNIQQMPKDPLVRSLFVPDNQLWGRVDWSQQEFRLLLHYAELCKLPRASEMADLFRQDNHTDFHSVVAEMTGLERTPAKSVTFGLMYSMGIDKMAAQIGKGRAETEAIRAQYFEKLPFAKELSEICRRKANRRGWIKNLLTGRRRHFNLWGPARGEGGPCSYKEAVDQWGTQIERWKTYRAMQALISGSGADMMKRGLIEGDKAGIDIILTVHDEVGIDGDRETAEKMGKIMEAIAPEVTVPMLAEPEIGKSWGECK